MIIRYAARSNKAPARKRLGLPPPPQSSKAAARRRGGPAALGSPGTIGVETRAEWDASSSEVEAVGVDAIAPLGTELVLSREKSRVDRDARERGRVTGRQAMESAVSP